VQILSTIRLCHVQGVSIVTLNWMRGPHSTVVLQCYRRQAVPMEQAKIRPSVTLHSLHRSLPNLVRLITSATPTHMPTLITFGWVRNSQQIG